jgi:hypothetical protein
MRPIDRREPGPIFDAGLTGLGKFIRRSTRASAKLENRQVPADYVRPEVVQRYIDERSARRASACVRELEDDGEQGPELPLET